MHTLIDASNATYAPDNNLENVTIKMKPPFFHRLIYHYERSRELITYIERITETHWGLSHDPLRSVAEEFYH